MSMSKEFHTVTINREKDIDPKNSLKIDGKFIHGITNVKIEFGINERYPIITIEFLAKKLNAQVKSKNIREIKEIS